MEDKGISEIVKPYMEIFEALGVKVSLHRLIILEWIIKNGSYPFKIAKITRELGFIRTDIYQSLAIFVKTKIVTEIPSGILTQEEKEYIISNYNAKVIYKKEKMVMRSRRYKFAPEKVIETIDKKIEHLKRIKSDLIFGRIGDEK